MMMFSFHIALATSLIALASGIALLGWAKKFEGGCRFWCNLFGFIITILAILSVACTLWTGVQLWKGGYLEGPKMMEMMEQNTGEANKPAP